MSRNRPRGNEQPSICDGYCRKTRQIAVDGDKTRKRARAVLLAFASRALLETASPGQETREMSHHGAPSGGGHGHSPNVVGVHYRVGRKVGEGSFGIIYEGRCFVYRLSCRVTT